MSCFVVLYLVGRVPNLLYCIGSTVFAVCFATGGAKKAVCEITVPSIEVHIYSFIFSKIKAY